MGLYLGTTRENSSAGGFLTLETYLNDQEGESETEVFEKHATLHSDKIKCHNGQQEKSWNAILKHGFEIAYSCT